MVPAQKAIHVDVDVVVPTWRGRHHLEHLLPTIAAQTLLPRQVILVDAPSEDGTIEIARQYGARLLPLERNFGFAAAVNRGIEATTSPLVAVLNNDLRLHPEWLANLARTDAPFCCGKIYQWETDDTLDGAWDELSLAAVPLRAGSGAKDGPYWSQPQPIQFAPWTAVLLRRDCLERIGGLDETFESYLEDVDFGLRAASMGLQGWYEPTAVCWHRGSATLGAWHPRQVRLTARNQLKLVGKHGGANWLRAHGRHVLLGQLLWGALAAKHGCLGPWIRGKWDARHELRRSTPFPIQELHAAQDSLDRTLASAGADRFWRLYRSLT
jgi:hypothetical protein